MAAQNFNPKPSIIPIDEAEEFFDPFSKLNQALSRFVKNAIDEGFCSTHPSTFSEHQLMEHILPQFKKEFPKYRIGATAVKRVWETVILYYNKVKSKESFLNSDGSVNIEELINESMSQIDFNQSFHSFHPYSFAHRIARQVAECCLIINNHLPSINELSKMIWGTMQHMIPNQTFEPLDPIDAKLTYLSLIHSESAENIDQLKDQLTQSITPYIKLPEPLAPLITTIAAQTKLNSLKIFDTFSKKTILGIEHFLEEHITRYTSSSTFLSQHEIVERVTSLYRLTAGIDQTFAQAQLEDAIQYVYSLSTNKFSPASPNLSSSIYAFINAEIIISKELKSANPLESILTTLMNAFEMTTLFPRLNEDQIEELSVWTYALLNKEKVDYPLIQDEVNIHLIANPNDSFATLIEDVNKKVVKLSCALTHFEPQLKSRIETVCHQSDMAAAKLSAPYSSLFQYVKSQFTPNLRFSLTEMISTLKAGYIALNLSLKPIDAALGQSKS